MIRDQIDVMWLVSYPGGNDIVIKQVTTTTPVNKRGLDHRNAVQTEKFIEIRASEIPEFCAALMEQYVNYRVDQNPVEERG